MEEVLRIEKAEEEAREEKEKKENEEKMKTMSPEKKEDFMKHIAEHEAEEALHKKEKVLWIESKKPHECDLDPNAKSPLAGCRNKHPPTDNYKPYIGAAE